MLNQFKDNHQPRNKAVLILDDDQDLIGYLARQCCAIGLTVFVANDATSAVEILEQRIPDLLIIDASMPAGNGARFIEAMGLNPKGCKIPAIVLCQDSDLNSVPKVETMVTQYAYKSRRNWPRIEAFIRELVEIDPNSTTVLSELENLDNLNKGAN